MVLVGAACAPQPVQTPTGVEATQTAAPQATAQGFRFGVPVENESQALSAAEAGLGTGFRYSQPLKVVAVEETSYGAYSQLMGGGSDRPADLKIWLVVYRNEAWQSIASRPDVTPSPLFHGCVAVAINAADGLLLEVGGPVEKSQNMECAR